MATETNLDFANANERFREMCQKAGCEPTRRQASKYMNKYGKAYKYAHGITLSASKR